jgi:hypothetical protein
MAETPEELRENAQSMEATFKSVANEIGEIFRNVSSQTDGMAKAFGKDVQKQLLQMVNSTDTLVENQVKMAQGALKSKDIAKQILDVEIKQEIYQKRIGNLMREQPQLADRLRRQLEDVDEVNQKITTELKEQLAVLEAQEELEKKEKKKKGVVEDVAKSLGLGKVAENITKLHDAYNGLKKEGAERVAAMETFTTAIKAVGAAIITGLVNSGFKADEQTSKLANSLTQTKFEAALTRDNLADMARESDNVFITTEKLVQSTLKLGQQLGISKTFSADLTKEFTTLTTQMGLSEDAAGGLAKLTVANGANARTVTTEALGAAQALQAQNGIQLDNRQILEETGKVSGQLLANFKGNPAEIAKAVTQTKLLGTTLEQTKKQSSALLDFQSSIQNELSAELFTGQQLNLERARALALAGDQAGVAKELANQNMDFTKFSKLNVLAQNEFAKSLGLNADELSDQLLKQKYLGKSKTEVAALEGEEVAKRLEAMTAQDKFNASVEKLKDIFVSLVDGPVGSLIDFVADLFSLIGGIGKAISGAIPPWLQKIIAGASAGAGAGLVFGGVGAIPGAIAGAAAAGGMELYKANANDLMSGYGERTLVTPKGAFALNNSDTVIAGTNLFRGNDVYSGPKGALSMSGGSDVVDAIAKLGDRINQLAERPVVARPSEFVGPITSKQLQNSNRILV